jgi:hypothetical protein
MDRDDIITEALLILGVIPEGDSPSADQLTSCSVTLNSLVKAWQAEELNLFAIQTGYLFLVEGQRRYDFGTDHITTSYSQGTLDSAVVATDTTIDVTSNTASNGDYIGITLDDGSVHWTTVNGAPVGATITLIDAIDAAGSAGNRVVYYTTKANTPMQITEVVRRNTSGTDTLVKGMTRGGYFGIGQKATDGYTSHIYFENGSIYTYQPNSNSSDILVMKWERVLDDFDAATDDADFPQQWLMPLAWNLAVAIAPKYGVPPQHFQMVAQQAAYWKEVAEGWDRECTVFFQPKRGF